MCYTLVPLNPLSLISLLVDYSKSSKQSTQTQGWQKKPNPTVKTENRTFRVGFGDYLTGTGWGSEIFRGYQRIRGWGQGRYSPTRPGPITKIYYIYYINNTKRLSKPQYNYQPADFSISFLHLYSLNALTLTHISHSHSIFSLTTPPTTVLPPPTGYRRPTTSDVRLLPTSDCPTIFTHVSLLPTACCRCPTICCRSPYHLQQVLIDLISATTCSSTSVADYQINHLLPTTTSSTSLRQQVSIDFLKLSPFVSWL